MLTGDALTQRIIDMATEVHRHFGPGMLDSIYEASLCVELDQAGIPHERQAAFPVFYRDLRIEPGFYADIVVARQVMIEVKAVDQLSPEDDAQLRNYLKQSGYPIGLLLNFNAKRLEDGVRRFVL